MEIGGAGSPGVAATVELTVTNNAVVAANDGAAGLAALDVGAECGALPTKWNGVLGPCCARHAPNSENRPGERGEQPDDMPPGGTSGQSPQQFVEPPADGHITVAVVRCG